MHTLNLRLSPDEIGWIAADAEDRFLVVDDILLPLYRQFADKHAFEKVIVFPFSGAPVDTGAGLLDYEALLAGADPRRLRLRRRTTRTTRWRCATRRAPPAGRRASSTRTARPCCTRWSAASARTGACRSTDVLLPVTPMFHANCWGLPYGAVMLGTKIVFPGPHLHPDDLLDLMQAEPPTLSLGVPTIWLGLIQRYERALAEEPGRWKLPEGMRSMVGGAAVPEALIRAFARHGVWLDAGLGHDRDLAAGDGLDPRAERRAPATTSASAAPRWPACRCRWSTLRIRGDDGRDAPWDGKTSARSRCAARSSPARTTACRSSDDKFTDDGWLRTGDVAAMDELGFVRITDRTKDLIKSGGEWISSVDLENALMAHPAIAEAAVIAIPDQKWSERPLACIVFKPGQGGDAAAAEALGEHLLATASPSGSCPTATR